MTYSPVLSYVTAAFELGLVAFALLTRQVKTAARAVILLLLVLLAGYQIFEALNCSPAFLGQFSRAAFIDITWLPPVGLLYIAMIMRRRSYAMIAGGYLIAGAVFSIWFGVFDNSVILSHCDTIIAWYRHPMPMRLFYGLFYQSGVVLLMLLPLFRKGLSLSADDRRSLTLLQLGVLGFMVPSLITVLIHIPFHRALPSIMCHYALVLGIFLGILLFPREQRLTNRTDITASQA